MLIKQQFWCLKIHYCANCSPLRYQQLQQEWGQVGVLSHVNKGQASTVGLQQDALTLLFTYNLFSCMSVLGDCLVSFFQYCFALKYSDNKMLL